MSTAAIRQKLHIYLDVAKDKKVKAIYTILEEEIEMLVAKAAKKSETETYEKYKTYMNQSLGPVKTKESKKDKHKK